MFFSSLFLLEFLLVFI